MEGIAQQRTTKEMENSVPSGREIMQSALFLAVQHECGPMDKGAGTGPKNEEKREKMKRTLLKRLEEPFELLLAKFLLSWEAQNWQEKQTANLHQAFS
ncbi:hypothetical protein E5288_WYG019702 [Bos mutus]|uniref:Uncharacterized protein n=1 Tax=Bos mutus TaxID=72004 RepID=A0A6B0RSL9_9CETA|nr:hypothetical protein [Bos mutus]